MKGKIKLKNNSGITLVALVVTIIIMLILAGISLRFVWGEGGIIEKTERARIEHIRGEEKDILSLSHSALYIDNKAFGDAYETDKMHDEIQKHGKDTVVNWKAPGKIMRVRYKDTKNVYTIDVETGEIKFEGEYNEAIEQPELKFSDLEFTHNPAYWTNGNTKVTIQKNPKSNVNLDELTIQYSINSIDNWTTYTEPIEMSTNGTICVRLIYELIGEVSEHITNEETNIDKLDPTMEKIETESTSNSITVKATAKDATKTDEYGCSEIKGYYYSKDDGATYTERITDANYTFENLTQGTEYKIKVKIEDNAGNIIEKSKNVTTETVTGLTSANTRISTNPTALTNRNVTVTITTDVTGYTLQYKTEKTGESGEVNDWTNYTGPITVERNQRIYAKVVDRTGQSGIALSENVVNIDKSAPDGSLSVIEKTTATAIVNASATDSPATSDNACSGIKGYYYSKDDGVTYTGITTATTHKFTGLTQGTEYKFKVKIEDNVGNSKEIGNTENTNLINANITFGTPSWSGTNASITVTGAQAGCTLQYRIGPNGTWTNMTSGGTVSGIPSGTILYARLVEENNVGKEWASNKPLWTGTVSYNANGGSGGPVAQTAQHTNTVTVSFSPLPTRAGYAFAGWNTKADGTGTNYTSNGTKTFTMGTSDVTLYAKWTINQYTITYNANGGSGAPASQTKTLGQTLQLSTTKPTRSGYTFKGWKSNGYGAKIYQPGDYYSYDADATLTAVWEKNQEPVSATTAISPSNYGDPVNYSVGRMGWKVLFELEYLPE